MSVLAPDKHGCPNTDIFPLMPFPTLVPCPGLALTAIGPKMASSIKVWAGLSVDLQKQSVGCDVEQCALQVAPSRVSFRLEMIEIQ